MLSFLHADHVPPPPNLEKEIKRWLTVDGPLPLAGVPVDWLAGYKPDYLYEQSLPLRESMRQETGVRSSQLIMSGNEERSTALVKKGMGATRLEKELA